jgi:DNA-binding phage protein
LGLCGVLKTDDDIAYYPEAVFEDRAPTLVAAALGDVAPRRQTAHFLASSRGKAMRSL